MGNLTTTPRGSLFRPMLRDFFDFDNFFNKDFNGDWKALMPAANVQENDKQYVLEVVVPGFSKEDLNVNVENDMITISAEMKSEQEKAEKDYTRREYKFQSFSRSFQIPENVKDDAIQANYADGVLRLVLPKTEAPVTVSKKIAVQ